MWLSVCRGRDRVETRDANVSVFHSLIKPYISRGAAAVAYRSHTAQCTLLSTCTVEVQREAKDEHTQKQQNAHHSPSRLHIWHLHLHPYSRRARPHHVQSETPVCDGGSECKSKTVNGQVMQICTKKTITVHSLNNQLRRDSEERVQADSLGSHSRLV